MAYYHHNTLRKYVASMLSTFNELEVQHTNSSGETITKTIPIVYSTREKSRILSSETSEQLLSGNMNVLPRGSISLVSMNKTPERTTNKNQTIAKYKQDDTIDYQYNSVPYSFEFELTIMCRGMNEATQIIEQVCPLFNPTVNIDVWDGTNLDEPTRIPVSLEGVNIENDDYNEFSDNVMILSFSMTIRGNLYPPIKSIERIKELNININQVNNGVASTKTIMGWDVDDSGETIDETTIRNE